LVPGDAAWEFTGTAGTSPVTNFLGTTDAQPLIMRTNNIERGRITATGELLVGAPPSGSSEVLQVDGAIRLLGAAATTDAGVIQYNATTNRHEGNVDGTATGWVNLENPYNEVFNASFTQTGAITCANGTAQIPTPTGTTPFPVATSTNANMTPIIANQQRHRSQYILRRDEVDLALAQLNNPNQTQGLCAGQPINSIGFFIDGWGGTPQNFAALFKVSIKHTAFNAFTATGPFDNSVDPAGQCGGFGPLGYNLGPIYSRPIPATVNWQTFTFSSPFIWNGVDNILIDVCYTRSVGSGIARMAVVNGLPYIASKSHYGPASVGACATPGVAGCGSTFPIAGCGMSQSCTNGGAVNIRPEFRFNGVVASAPVPMASTGSYVQYEGGIVVEETPGYSLIGLPSVSFQGPGTVVAENGVYSNLSLLNDHVFDLYFDGRVAANEAELFGDRRHLEVEEMTNFIEEKRHLPTMKGRVDWIKNNGFSLDDLTNQLWVTAETQALYLTELNDQVDVLEMLSTDRPLSQEEFVVLKKEVALMPDLTDGKKEQLISTFASRVVSTIKK